MFDEKQFRTADDGVDALLDSLHGGEGLERFADEDHGGVTPLGHGHFLDRLQGEILFEIVGGETFLDDHDLIMNLGEADEEITVSGSGVDFVAQLLQRGLDPDKGLVDVLASEVDVRGWVGLLSLVCLLVEY